MSQTIRIARATEPGQDTHIIELSDEASQTFVEARVSHPSINHLIEQINQAAGQARQRHISDSPGQIATYQRKADEARLYRELEEDTSPQDTPILSAEAAALGISLGELAQQVLDQETVWIDKAAHIEATRRSGKVSISTAPNPAVATDLARQTLSELAAI